MAMSTATRRARCHGDLRAKRHDHVTPSVTSQRGTPRRLAPQPDVVYRCRRLVVGTLLAAVLVASGMGANAALNGSGGGPASAAGTGFVVDATPSVVAMPGDSLWSIARHHHGDVDFDRYLDKLIELNGGTAIQAGQLVRLP